jgi:hypothetical protein
MAAPVDPRVDDSNPTSLTAVAASLHTIAIHEDTTTTCHILRLPAELHLTIGEVLAEDTSACPLHLRQTNRYFASLIPAPTSSDLFALEEQSWAKDKRLYACKFCVRLRKATHFADYMLRRSNGARHPRADSASIVASHIWGSTCLESHLAGTHLEPKLMSMGRCGYSARFVRS